MLWFQTEHGLMMYEEPRVPSETEVEGWYQHQQDFECEQTNSVEKNCWFWESSSVSVLTWLEFVILLPTALWLEEITSIVAAHIHLVLLEFS